LSTELTLTPTSYIVLGLLRNAGSATPYELKAGAAGSVGNFWTTPHSQVYAEPDRLVRGGYATVEQETGGRRRKRYAITERGAAALDAWLADPQITPAELREPSLLKIFFGADPAAIAPGQLEVHRARLAEYQALRAALAGDPAAAGPVLTLDAGIAHTNVSIAYWERFTGSQRAPGR
jgi:DNA-binding PadR family transcriptional regulator